MRHTHICHRSIVCYGHRMQLYLARHISPEHSTLAAHYYQHSDNDHINSTNIAKRASKERPHSIKNVRLYFIITSALARLHQTIWTVGCFRFKKQIAITFFRRARRSFAFSCNTHHQLCVCVCAVCALSLHITYIHLAFSTVVVIPLCFCVTNDNDKYNIENGHFPPNSWTQAHISFHPLSPALSIHPSFSFPPRSIFSICVHFMRKRWDDAQHYSIEISNVHHTLNHENHFTESLYRNEGPVSCLDEIFRPSISNDHR